MSHAITNQPFALVRDHLRHKDEWHPLAAVQRLASGRSRRLEIVAEVFDYWFTREDYSAQWFGPFRLREQAEAFNRVMPGSVYY